jgi:hypothetical protein
MSRKKHGNVGLVADIALPIEPKTRNQGEPEARLLFGPSLWSLLMTDAVAAQLSLPEITKPRQFLFPRQSVSDDNVDVIELWTPAEH